MSRETRPIAADEARDFVFGDVEDHWVQVEDRIIEQGRWDTHHTAVWHDTRDDTYWRYYYTLGSTEYQDGQREFDDHMTRVYPIEVKRIEYASTPPALTCSA